VIGSSPVTPHRIWGRSRTLMAVMAFGVVIASVMAVGRSSPSSADVPVRAVDEQIVSPTMQASMQELLEHRGESVLSVDGSGDFFGSAADDEPRVRWERLVAGFAKLGLASYREELSQPVLDLAPPSLKLSNPGVVVVEVQRRYRLAGVDDRDQVDDLFLALQLGSDGWKVVDDDPLRHVGVTSSRPLWEVTEIEVLRSSGFVIAGAPSLRTRLGEVASIAAEARRTLEGVVPPDQILVLVPESTEQASEFLQTPLDLSKFVAFVSFSVDREVGWEPGPPRMVLQEGNLRRRTRARQVSTLAHELAHASTLGESGPNVAIWMHEGVAEWLSTGRSEGGSGELPIPEAHEFRTGAVSDIVAAYGRATGIAARLGDVDIDLPVELFRTVGSVRSAPGTVQFHVESTLAMLGVELALLEAGPL
jgi:hypothetical protein